jgi:hypothetical protein
MDASEIKHVVASSEHIHYLYLERGIIVRINAVSGQVLGAANLPADNEIDAALRSSPGRPRMG